MHPTHVLRVDGEVVRPGLVEQAGVDRLDRHHGPGPLGPPGVDGEVAGDGEQPAGRRAAPGIERLGVAPRPHEGLLGDVLGHPGVAEDAQREAEDAALISTHQDRGRLAVTGGQPGDQRVVARLCHAVVYGSGDARDWPSLGAAGAYDR